MQASYLEASRAYAVNVLLNTRWYLHAMCVLRVSGKHFDVDGLLASSGLTPCKVFRAGEPLASSRPDGGRHEESGFTVEVSRGSWSSLAGQASDAVC